MLRSRHGAPLAVERCEPRRVFALTPTLVADVNTDPNSAFPRDFVIVEDVAFFTATDAEHGRELWRTDGTTAGTSLVADFAPGSYSYFIDEMTPAAGRLFVAVNDPSSGGRNNLWSVDPATDAVEMIATRVVTSFYDSDVGGAFGILGTAAMLFSRDTTNGAREFWKTDGTQAGTTLVRSFPGINASGYNGPEFVSAGGMVYFGFNDRSSGWELWQSDGTPAGTKLVKNIAPGSASSNPTFVGVVGDTVLFSANDGSNGFELWRTDPVAGAVRVTNLNPAGSSYFYEVIAVGETLFMSADATGTAEATLWRIDAFRSATPQVTAFSETVNGRLARAGDHVYFSSDDGRGVELWRVATAGGSPEIVKEIYEPFATEPFANNPGVPAITAESEPNDSIAQADDLRGSFTEIDGVSWATVSGVEDGFAGNGDWFRVFLPAGYQLRVEIDNGVEVDYFASTGEWVWSADSGPFTAWEAGDYFVRAGSWSFSPPYPSYSATFEVRVAAGDAYPYGFTVVGDTLYFTATDHDHGLELWRTDPVSGAVLVKDLNPGEGSSYPTALTPVGNELFFRANGDEIWKASVAGGATKLSAGLDDPYAGSGSYGAMAVLDGKLLFTADDGTSGYELWATDVATGASDLVSDIDPSNRGAFDSSLSYRSRAVLDGVLYFTANGGDGQGFELWRSNGTAAGTALVADIDPGLSYGLYGGGYPRSGFPDELTPVGNVLYFVASTQDQGRELWKTDGTEAGTKIVKDIATNPFASGDAAHGLMMPSSYPADLTAANGILYFTADDAGKRRLWKSDGTAAGTLPVAGLNVDQPTNLTAFGGGLYFTATDAASGEELRRLDLATGTLQSFDFTAGTAGTAIESLVVVGDALLFTVGETEGTLWKFVPATGGQPAGREQLKSFWYLRDTDYGRSALLDDVLYFTADDKVSGAELWRTDGTAAGTVLVKDIYPGSYYGSPLGSAPQNFVAFGGKVYFTAEDASGLRLWQTDGTGAGTMKADFVGEPDFALIGALGPVGGGYLVMGSDPLHGVELWSLSTASAGATIGTSGSLAALSTVVGTASAATTVSVTGSNLAGAIVATAPAGFEVSSNGTTFGPTASFTPSAGSVTGTLSVRIAASTSVGTYSGSVSLASPGVTAVGVAIPSSSVTNELVFDVALGQTVTHAASGSGVIKYVKRGGGTLILDKASSHGGGTVVEAGEVIVRNIAALGSGMLEIRAGAKVTLDVGSVNWNGNTNFLALPQLQLDPAGRFEIGTGQIRVAAGGFDASMVRQALLAGRSTGAWNGTTGFTSASAGAGTSRAIGYRVMSTGELRLGFAALGDANLDGQVSQADINLVVSGGRFGQGSSTGSAWIDGDFNYSGGVTQADINLLVGSAKFGQGGYLPAQPTSSTTASSTADADLAGWAAYAAETVHSAGKKRR